MSHPDTIADRRARHCRRYPGASGLSRPSASTAPRMSTNSAPLHGTGHTMRVVIEVDIGTWQNTGASRHPQIFLTRPAPRFGEAGTYGVGADGKRIYGPVWNIRATADSNTLVQICPLTGGRRGRGAVLLLGAALLDLFGGHRSYQLGVAGTYRAYRTNLNSLYRTSHDM